MLFDSDNVNRDALLKADLCVVGGGMAGIALGHELRGSGIRVVVLESGVQQFHGGTQSLYNGDARLEDGQGNSVDISAYLRSSRLRLFGGSGNAWGAKCGVLDECDFETRDWLPGSGWPMSRRDLSGFYDRACDLLQIPRFDYDPNTEFDEGRPPLRLDDDAHITTVTRHHSPVSALQIERFREYRSAITDTADLDVYLNANVTALLPRDDGTGIEEAVVRTLNGNGYRVKARAFVLATGGIENARLLLLSDAETPAGLGNQNDMVGRYFGGHVTFGLGGMLYFPREGQNLDLYTGKDRGKIWGVLATSLAAQRRSRLPNFTVTLNPAIPIPEQDLNPCQVAAMTQQHLGAPATRAAEVTNEVVPSYFMSEQAPNPESRVALGSDRDALGQRRVRLTWRFEDHDFAWLRRGIGTFANGLGASATARLRAEISTTDLLGALNMSRHHIGSTRMSVDPESGVVDPDCKVHGLNNLFVAGSSVFPTTGIANPTLTLIALTIRLADHLKAALPK